MSENIFDRINCDIDFKDNLTRNINIKVEKIYIKNKPYIIKKENTIDDNILQEFLFYKNFAEQIKKDKMNKNLNLPLKILDCESDSKMYIFNYIDNDYIKEYIHKYVKSYKTWLDYTIQLCLSIYYMNHILGVYHNDLCYKGELRNIMIKNNDIPFTINFDNFTYTINNNYIVLIDFGQQNSKIGLRTYKFYYNKYKKIRRKYKYESEVFIVFYYSYIFFFNIKDEWIDKYDEIYDKFVKEAETKDKISSTKGFDKYLINSMLKDFYTKYN
jgi:hypothetical protein